MESKLNANKLDEAKECRTFLKKYPSLGKMTEIVARRGGNAVFFLQKANFIRSD